MTTSHAWRLPPGDHSDLVDGIVMRQQGTHDGVARFVVGDELLRSVVLPVWQQFQSCLQHASGTNMT